MAVSDGIGTAARFAGLHGATSDGRYLYLYDFGPAPSDGWRWAREK